MKTPESIKGHSRKYCNHSWMEYSIAELGWWVHLLIERASHRNDLGKRAKDVEDAQNYLNMMQAHIDATRTPQD